MIGLAPFRVPGSARWHTAIYRAASTLVSRRFLASPNVECIYLRRSVAAGEAQFPWSDADLGIVLSAFPSDEDEGRALKGLWQRFRLARTIFPRLGEALIYTLDDLSDSVVDDPYRASIDRRAALAIYGGIPAAAPFTVSPRDAIRRLVFWLDTYLPRALRQRNHRNARKFAIEIWNAWRTASGCIEEPFLSRRDAEQDWRHSLDAPLLSEANRNAEGAFRVSLSLATRAHAILRPPLPRLSKTISFEARFLPGTAMRTVHLLPSADAPFPPEALRQSSAIFTLEALDLFLNTQNPFLWHGLPAIALDCGVPPPNPEAWLHACRRLAARERLRVAGFAEPGIGDPSRRLRHVAHALSILELGASPSAESHPEVAQASPEAPVSSIAAYYRDRYAPLLRKAIALRHRAQHLFDFPPRAGASHREI